MNIVEEAFFVIGPDDIDNMEQDFLLGYAVCDDAIVLGQDGADQYQERFQRAVPLHEDGCYVAVQKHPDNGVVIGTDHAGIMPVFYFRQGKDWLISNSFVLLIEEMRKKRFLVEVDWVAFSVFASVHRSLHGFETVAEGVRLMPSTARLFVNDTGLREEAVNFPTPVPYREALQKGFKKWMSVIVAVTNDPQFSVSVDLSGGVDSRTAFAFYSHLITNKAISKSDIAFHTGVGRNPSPKRQKDADAALNVAAVKGYDISTVRGSDLRLSPAKTFRRWQLRQLGYHADIVFNFGRNTTTVFSGGFGGEFLRPMRSTNPYLAGLRAMALMTPHLLVKWCQAILRIARCVKSHPRHRNTSVGLYQEFLGRAHFGTVMSQQFRMEPLTGRDFRQAILDSPEDALKRRQVFFDIMHSLDADLPALPYDEDGKSFSQDCVSNLTKVPIAEISDIQIFGSRPFNSTRTEPEAPEANSKGVWELFRSEVDYRPKQTVLRRFPLLLSWILLNPGRNKAGYMPPRGKYRTCALHAMYLLNFLLSPKGDAGNKANDGR